MPFDSLPGRDQAALEIPSATNLAHILRNKVLWPDGFHWDYACGSSCAIGLCKLLWGERGYDAVSRELGPTKACTTFLAAHLHVGALILHDVQPEHVAGIIEGYLTKQEGLHMSPFIADTLNRTPTTPTPPTEHVPDLSQPSVAGLAYMLRHQETWPAEFGPWDFQRIPGCAMGLALKAWGVYIVGKPEFDKARYAGTFSNGTYPTLCPTPEEVAAHLEHATAAEE